MFTPYRGYIEDTRVLGVDSGVGATGERESKYPGTGRVPGDEYSESIDHMEVFTWDFGDSATVLRQKFCDSATVEQRCAIKETENICDYT